MALTRALALSLLVVWPIAPVATAATPARVVTTVALDTVLQTPRYDAPATVVARDAPSVTAEITATVLEVPVIVGDLVQSGDLLASLDCARFEAQRDAAQADLERAKAQQRFADRQLQRARDLRRNKSISEELVDQRETELATATTDVRSARAGLRQREIDVASCAVRAPLAGVITARHVGVGDYLNPGSPMVDMTASAGLEVSVSLRADQVTGFEAAPDWTLTANGQTFPLRMRTVVPVIDDVSRTREARMTFHGAAAIPGTPGRVSWSGRVPQIPSDYLIRRNGRLGVFVLDAGTARFVALPGAQEGRPATTSLPVGTLLIDEGRQGLSDGEAVVHSDAGAGAE